MQQHSVPGLGPGEGVDVPRQVSFFARHVAALPARAYERQDALRLTWLYFAVAALDVLGADAELRALASTHRLVDFVYSLQHRESDEDHDDVDAYRCGFRGHTILSVAPSYASLSDYSQTTRRLEAHHQGDLAMTYAALALLCILGDDMSRVHRNGIVRMVRSLQRSDGSFQSSRDDVQADLRFVYCACAISTILGDWSGVDRSRAVAFVQSCQRYDGAFGLVPHAEGHGGATYVAIASLALMNRLDAVRDQRRLIAWCLQRQGDAGFHGRPNKPPDTCYAFWIGATLRLLHAHVTSPPPRAAMQPHQQCSPPLDGLDSAYRFTHVQRNYAAIVERQGTAGGGGGFAKEPGAFTDLLHSYMGVAAISLMQNAQSARGCTGGVADPNAHDDAGADTDAHADARLPRLRTLHVALGLSERAWQSHIQRCHV